MLALIPVDPTWLAALGTLGLLLGSVLSGIIYLFVSLALLRSAARQQRIDFNELKTASEDFADSTRDRLAKLERRR